MSFSSNGPNPGPVYKLLVEVAKLPKEERKAALVARLDHLWDVCMERTYTNKHGDSVPNPDTATALRVVEVADALLCETADEKSKGSKFAALQVFDGGRKQAQ